MPYTFGGATGDDITWGLVTTLGQTNTDFFLSGWWYPTTLTNSRCLWSAGSIIRCAIRDNTTGELTLQTDNTTDGVWVASAAINVNEWRFLAFFLTTFNTGPAATWKMWAGKLEEAPTPVTVSPFTTPVGNFTGNGNFTLGNLGSGGTVAFQGDIGEVQLVCHSATATGNNTGFGLAAHGAVNAAEEQMIYERCVMPAWRGESLQPFVNRYSLPEQFYAPLDGQGAAALRNVVGFNFASSTTTPSSFNATLSARAAPRRPLWSHLHQHRPVLRPPV